MLQALKHRGEIVTSELQLYLGSLWRSEQVAWSKLWRYLPPRHRLIVLTSFLMVTLAPYFVPALIGQLIDDLVGARGLGAILSQVYSNIFVLMAISFLFLAVQKYFNQYEDPAYSTLMSWRQTLILTAVISWGLFHGWFFESLLILSLIIISGLRNKLYLQFPTIFLSLVIITNILKSSLESIASRAVTLGEGLQIITWLFIFSVIIFERGLYFLYRK